MTRFIMTIGRIILSSIALVLATAPVSANPISYEFTVMATSGPLSGITSVGTLTFDSAVIPPGGGLVSVADLFSGLTFDWDGVSYSAATANTGSLEFSPAGTLIGAFFGTNCGPSGFGCGVTAGTHDWELFANPPPGNGGFDYASPSDPVNTFFQSGGVALSGPVRVPTPGTLPLLGLAFAAWLLCRASSAGRTPRTASPLARLS